MFVNLGILRQNNVFIHRGANAGHVSTVVKYVTIRAMKNAFIKNGRIFLNNEEKERASRNPGKADLFLSSHIVGRTNPPIKSGVYHTCCDNSRLPFAERRKLLEMVHGRLAKTHSQMIDPVKRRYTQKYALSRTNRARSGPFGCLPLRFRKGYSKIPGVRRNFLISAHV